MMARSLGGVAPGLTGPAAELGTGGALLLDGDVMLVRHAGAWDDLARRADASNPFYGRLFVSAHAAGGLAGGMRWLVARQGSRWVGALPFRPRGARLGFLRAHVAWRSPYTPSSRPLADAADLPGAVAALLDAMAGQGGPWLLPDITLDDGLGRAILAGVAARGWSSARLDGYERAIFRRREGDAATGAARTPKDLARRRRRLAEAGRVAVETVAEPGAALAAACERFVALEASGWKGRRGTALGSRPETRAMAETLGGNAAGPARLRADELTLDGIPIAASLSVVSGGVAYLWKAAYAEEHARFSPGNLLELELVEAMHRTGFASCLNSVARPGTPLDALFPDREQVADLAVDPRADARPGIFAAAVAVERRRRAALDLAKSVLRRMRPPS